MTEILELTIEIDDPVHEQMYNQLTEETNTPVEPILAENLEPQTEQLLYQLYQRSKQTEEAEQ